MPKLTDTQLVILSAAAQRRDGTVLPLPKSLKAKASTATKTLEGLLKKDLLIEKPAARNATAWREGEDGRRMMLVITDAGLQTIGVGADETASNRSTPTKTRAKSEKSQATARPGTKQALLINLLKRRKGATIEAIVKTLEWLPHTVRAAITRLRQQGFQIERVRKDRVTRYHIAEDRQAV